MNGEEHRLPRLVTVADASENRRSLLVEIADGFSSGRTRFTPSQLEYFSVILNEAIDIDDADLRRDIAARLAASPLAPRELVKALANDDFAIAEPLLRLSPALNEDDLVRLASRASPAHRRAIAARPVVSDAVAQALAIHGDAETLIELIGNPAATISAETLTRLVGRARTLAALHAPLLQRADLDATALTRLFFLVASPLKREILERADAIASTALTLAIADNRRDLVSTISEARHDDAAVLAIRKRIAAGAVSETLLNELIEQGKIEEFRVAFAHYLGVSAAAATEILNDHTWQALAIMCRAAALERSTFARITSCLLKDGDEHNKAVHMLDIYRRIPQEAADKIARFWRSYAAAPAASGEGCAATERHCVAI